MKSVGKTASRITVVCCNCNRRKDHNGVWVENDESSARFMNQVSHSICPDCFKAIYPARFHNLLDKDYPTTSSHFTGKQQTTTLTGIYK